MRKSILACLAAATLVWGLGSCSSTNTETATGATAETVSATEANTFPQMAASSDMFELRSSELAKSRAIHPAVQIFAKMMREEHENTSEELRSLAASKNITLPTTMLPVHQRLMDPLMETNIGEKFDKRYMEAQIKAHEQAIALYDQAVTNETDPELRAFAGRVLPKLRDHLVMAKKAKDVLD